MSNTNRNPLKLKLFTFLNCKLFILVWNTKTTHSLSLFPSMQHIYSHPTIPWKHTWNYSGELRIHTCIITFSSSIYSTKHDWKAFIDTYRNRVLKLSTNFHHVIFHINEKNLQVTQSTCSKRGYSHTQSTNLISQQSNTILAKTIGWIKSISTKH